MKKKVVILDYGTGNILSLTRSLNYIGIKPIITNSASEILKASHLILPGVGSFGTGMTLLNKYNLPNIIKKYVKTKKPMLGICLGMQLLFENSNEFSLTNGLKLVNGTVRKFKNNHSDININIGWDKLDFTKSSFKQIFGKFEGKNFYFIHSYYSTPANPLEKIANSTHGKLKFCSIAKKKNIFGTQFHPEKSGKEGIDFLREIKKII